jgi:hypothetical protein
MLQCTEDHYATTHSVSTVFLSFYVCVIDCRESPTEGKIYPLTYTYKFMYIYIYTRARDSTFIHIRYLLHEVVFYYQGRK